MKQLSVIFTLFLTLTTFKAWAYFENDPCGKNLTWKYNSVTKVLHISGTGDMYNFHYSQLYASPWSWVNAREASTIIIDEGVTSIGNYAFYNFNKLTSVSIPNTLTSIGQYAFYGCTSLPSVTIPNSVTSIGQDAFYGCTSLSSVTIPNSVTSIGDFCFHECPQFTNLMVEEGNTHYDSRNNCNAIIETSSNTLLYGSSNTIIPNSVTSIGNFAFYNNSGLTSIKIPNSVTSIGQDAFCGCTGLTSINIPESVTSIGYEAFMDCSGLTSVEYNAVDCKGSVYLWFRNCNLTSLKIGDKVKRIPAYLAYNQKSLTSIKIPNSVTTIEEYAFKGCSGLTSIKIPNSVTSIGAEAFYGFRIKKLEIYSDPICYLDKFKFLDQDNTKYLQELVIGDEVNYFYPDLYCPVLQVVTFGKSLNSFEFDTFEGCKFIKIINLRNPIPTSPHSYTLSDFNFTNYIFNNTVVYVPNEQNAIELYKAHPFWGKFLHIEEKDFSGINDIKVDETPTEDVYYNLHGQRVFNPTPGIYIHNGKKELVR